MKTTLISTLVAAMLGLAALPSLAADFSTVYRVNSEVITQYEIDQMSALLTQLGEDGNNPVATAENFLIDDRILRIELGRLGFVVEPSQIQSTIDRMGGGDGNALASRLAGQGIDRSTLETYVSSQMMRRTYSEARGVNSPITDEEIQKYIDEIPDQVIPTIKISEMIIPYAEYGGRIPARYEFRLIKERLRRGESFASIAREKSRSSSAENGGSIGEIPVDGLNDNIRALLRGVQPGGLSRPLEQGGAIIVLRLDGYGEIRNSLPRNPKVTYIEIPAGSEQNAAALRAKVDSCAHATQRAGALVYEDVPVSSVDGATNLALSRMEVGTSAIYYGDSQPKLLFLCSRQTEVPEEYSEAVIAQAQSQAIARRLSGALGDLRASATIVKLK